MANEDIVLTIDEVSALLDEAERLWQQDRGEETLVVMQRLVAQHPRNVLLQKQLEAYHQKVCHLDSEEAYYEWYSRMAEEHEPGEISSVVWRAMWVVKRAYALASDPDFNSLLDIGCGNGESTVWFGDATGLSKVVGVDLVLLCVERARQNPRNSPIISYEVCDAEKLDGMFSENEFDIAVLGGILEHVRTPDLALAQAKRVVRPGGVIFINVPYGGFSYWGEPDNEQWQHVRFWNPYQNLQFEHMEIEYKSHANDPNLPWSFHGEVGDFCILLWNRK